MAIPRHTWELSQIEIHNLRQLVGVVLINCQLAQRGTLTEAEAVRRSVSAIATQQASQYEAFRILFAATPIEPARPQLTSRPGLVIDPLQPAMQPTSRE